MSRTIHTLPIDKRSHQHYHHNATVVLATPSAKSATRSSAQRERQPLPGLISLLLPSSIAGGFISFVTIGFRGRYSAK